MYMYPYMQSTINYFIQITLVKAQIKKNVLGNSMVGGKVKPKGGSSSAPVTKWRMCFGVTDSLCPLAAS